MSWRALSLLLTFGLSLALGILIRLEHQRRAALRILEQEDADCRVWLGPFDRHPIHDPPDLADARSHLLLYPRVIATHSITPGFSAALQVLQPQFLIITTHTAIPLSFWAELSHITSVHALQITTQRLSTPGTQTSPPFGDPDLHALSQLPQLKALTLSRSAITLGGLHRFLQDTPQLSSIRLSKIQPPIAAPDTASTTAADIAAQFSKMPPHITALEVRSILTHHPGLTFHLDGQIVTAKQ